MQTLEVSTRDEWQLELAKSYKDPRQLLTTLGLDPNAFNEHLEAKKLFSFRVPRPFVELMEAGNPQDPLLRQVLPLADEFTVTPGYSTDPLNEVTDKREHAVPQGLLHKYASRVLLLVQGACAINCRYCFRRHYPYADDVLPRKQFDECVEYVRQNQEVNEVILSGGDPLFANDGYLIELADKLAELKQIKRLRIHSRLPVVLPQRLTERLATHLTQRFEQVILVIHANHANEIGSSLKQHLATWRQRGVTLLNQSVLLKTINDDADSLSQLSERLFDASVLPYYLHQLDPVQGAAHFAISDARARELWQQINARLPGFLVPKLVREIPNRDSKTPIMPSE